jgi:hypothetical protein
VTWLEVLELDDTEPEDGCKVVVVDAEPVLLVLLLVVSAVADVVACVEAVDVESAAVLWWPEYDVAARAANPPVRPIPPAKVQRVRLDTFLSPSLRALVRSFDIREVSRGWMGTLLAAAVSRL